MRAIEVKYRVDDLEGLLAALKARGIEASDPIQQDDQACLEYETEVTDGEAMHPAALHAVGPQQGRIGRDGVVPD